MGVPQIILMTIFISSLVGEGNAHREEKGEKYNFWRKLFETSIIVSLLIWGGFFK